MKQPKKMTKKIKMQLKERKLNPDNWGLIEEDNDSYTVINKNSGKISTYEKQDLNPRQRKIT